MVYARDRQLLSWRAGVLQSLAPTQIKHGVCRTPALQDRSCPFLVYAVFNFTFSSANCAERLAARSTFRPWVKRRAAVLCTSGSAEHELQLGHKSQHRYCGNRITECGRFTSELHLFNHYFECLLNEIKYAMCRPIAYIKTSKWEIKGSYHVNQWFWSILQQYRGFKLICKH